MKANKSEPESQKQWPSYVLKKHGNKKYYALEQSLEYLTAKSSPSLCMKKLEINDNKKNQLDLFENRHLSKIVSNGTFKTNTELKEMSAQPKICCIIFKNKECWFLLAMLREGTARVL